MCYEVTNSTEIKYKEIIFFSFSNSDGNSIEKYVNESQIHVHASTDILIETQNV